MARNFVVAGREGVDQVERSRRKDLCPIRPTNDPCERRRLRQLGQGVGQCQERHDRTGLVAELVGQRLARVAGRRKTQGRIECDRSSNRSGLTCRTLARTGGVVSLFPTSGSTAADHVSDEIVCGSKHCHVAADNSLSRYLAAGFVAGHDPLADLDRPMPSEDAVPAADAGPGAVGTDRWARRGARSWGLARYRRLDYVWWRARRWAVAPRARRRSPRLLRDNRMAGDHHEKTGSRQDRLNYWNDDPATKKATVDRRAIARHR